MAEILQNLSDTQNEIIKKKEQELFEMEFIKTGEIKKYPEGHVRFIKDGIYGVFLKKNGISHYDHDNGEIYFSIGGLLENPFFVEAKKNSGYIEKRDINGKFGLYKVDSNGKVGDIPINQYSADFLQAWQNIDFYIFYKVSKLPENKRFSKEQFLQVLPTHLKSESFRVKDLMEFYARGQIQKIDIIEQLPALQKLLEKQCDPNGDLIGNFEKINDSITEDELKSYYDNREIFKSKGLIDERLYAICISGLRKRENEKKINKDTKEEIKR